MRLITQSRVVVHPQSVCGKQWFRCAFDFASVSGKSGIPHHGYTQLCAPALVTREAWGTDRLVTRSFSDKCRAPAAWKRFCTRSHRRRKQGDSCHLGRGGSGTGGPGANADSWRTREQSVFLFAASRRFDACENEYTLSSSWLYTVKAHQSTEACRRSLAAFSHSCLLFVLIFQGCL